MDPDTRHSEPGPSVRPTVAARTAAQYRRLSVALAASDFVSILAAFLFAYVVRFGFHTGKFDFLLVLVFAPPAFVAVFSGFRLYSTHRLSSAEEFRRLFFALTVGITGVVTVSYWTKAQLSRLWVGFSWLLCLLLLFSVRRVWHHFIFEARKRGRLTYRTLIVGGNDEAAHLARLMQAVPAGYEPVGFVSTDGNADGMDGLGHAGSVSDLGPAIGSAGAECLFVASSALRERDMTAVTKAARQAGIEVRVSANIPQMLSTRLAAQPLGGTMAFSVWPVRLTGVQAVVKRSFDLVLGSVAMVPTLVLWLPVTLAIKIGSKGPAVYRQTRVGRHGREFVLLKFRTMRGDDAGERPTSDVEGPLFKAKADPRVTGVGRFLRRWSLDELPQLVNVLKGNMSLVGPRPPLPDEVAQYEDWQRDRLEVRPGMTGLWQVSGRSDLSFDDYIRLDLSYIENWSPTYDLYLLAKTVPAVITGRGAL